MGQMIEVVYEDNVLKPLTPIEGLRKSEKFWVLIYPHPAISSKDQTNDELMVETGGELNLLDLEGKIEFAEDYDYKALREGR